MADVRQIMADLLQRSGIPIGQLDVDAVQGILGGVVLGEQASIRQALEQLQGFFQLDSVEENGKLAFVPRGKASVISISENELLGRAEEALSIERLAETELPEQLDVVYLDPASDYQAAVQTSLRQTSFSKNKQSLKTALVLPADRAKQQADTLLSAAWVERYRLKFSLPPKYLTLSPGDVVDLITESRTWRLRLVTVLWQENRLEIETVTTDADAYVQSTAGVGNVVTSQVQRAGISELFLLDIPLDVGAVDQPAFFMAVGKPRGDQQWQYSTVYESFDDENYTVSEVLTLEAITGQAVDALGVPVATAYVDDLNVVTVTVSDGTLNSVTEAELLTGANVALLGDEIIQFRDAVLTGVHTYELRGLLRARRGTDWAMDSHVAGDRFVLLGPEVTAVNVASDLLSVERFYKAVSSGALLDDAGEQSFTPNAVNLKPFSPVHLVAEGESDITLSWIRRSRQAGGWTDGADVPLAEETESYDIDIVVDGDVVRSLSSTTPSVVYNAAMQTSDGIAMAGVVEARVYQRSAVVGRGYPASIPIMA